MAGIQVVVRIRTTKSSAQIVEQVLFWTSGQTGVYECVRLANDQVEGNAGVIVEMTVAD